MTEEEKILNRQRIGLMLAEIRRSKGLSLEVVAEKAGIDYSNLSKIERGRYNVGIDILYRICKALGVDIKIE